MGKWNHVAVGVHRREPCKLKVPCGLVVRCKADGEEWPCAAERLRADARRALEALPGIIHDCAMNKSADVEVSLEWLSEILSAALGEEAG